MATAHSTTLSAPRQDFPLTPRHDRSRWVKKIAGLGIKYFGTGSDPKEAERHYQEFVRTGVYKTPGEWAGKGVKKPARKRANTRKIRRDDVPELLKNTPLRRANNGGFYAFVGGKQVSFPSDPNAALQRYRDLIDGRARKHDKGAATVEDVCDMFLADREELVDAGDYSTGRWLRYKEVSEVLIGHFTKSRLVDDIAPSEWKQFYRVVLTKKQDGTKAAYSYANDRISNITNMMRWAHREGLIREVDFGEGWKLFDAEKVAAQQEERSRGWTRDEIHAFLDHESSHPIRQAIILLGINCGLGNQDIADLTPDVVDFKDGWLDFRRGKTNRPRKIKLWPETITALQRLNQSDEEIAEEAGFSLSGRVKVTAVAKRLECSTSAVYSALRARSITWEQAKIDGQTAVMLLKRRTQPEPINGAAKLLLRTSTGEPFVRFADGKKGKCRVDTIRTFTNRATKTLGFKGLSFYKLRHTFNTLAKQSGCPGIVVEFMMGHLGTRVARSYMESGLIQDEHLIRASDYVHGWLFD